MPVPSSGSSLFSGANVGGILGAAGDLFGAAGSFVSGQANSQAAQYKAQGYELEAANFNKAADAEMMNKYYSGANTQIQEAMTGAKIYQSISGARADIAGAGLSESGTAGNILRSSAQQGALSEQLLASQGYVEQNNYQMQADAYRTEAQASDLAAQSAQAQASAGSESGIMGAIGGVLGAAAKIAPMFLAA